MPRPRVAFVTDADEYGGAEQYLVLLANALGALDAVGARYALSAYVNDRATELADRLRAAGVAVHTVPGLVRLARPGAVVALAKALRAHRPDVVHVNLTDQGDGRGMVAGVWLSRRPMLTTLHNVIPGRTEARERLSRLVLARPARRISVSSMVATYLEAAGLDTVVVENGIAPVVPHPAPRAELGLAPDALVIGGIGRLHPQKGWDVLVEAAPAIAADLPGSVLVVVGEGDERARLEARPGAGHVRFVGYREAASTLVGAFDLLVVPSRYESFGLVVVEAMLAGVPVVATAVPGLEGVVGDAGVLVPPEDPEQLAKAVVALARDPDRRSDLAARGRRRAEERYGVERMARETAAVYDRLLASTR